MSAPVSQSAADGSYLRASSHEGNSQLPPFSLLLFEFKRQAMLSSFIAFVSLGLFALAAPVVEQRAACADVMVCLSLPNVLRARLNTDGTAKVIFARGTTEAPPIGTVAGPPLQAALKTALGGKSLSFQGVDYPADIPGFLAGGDAQGSKTMAADV